MKKYFYLFFAFVLLFASQVFGYGGARTYPIDADNVKISKSSSPSMWQGYEFGRPTGSANFFDDFFKITLAEWVITETGAGTEAITDAENGVLLLTNAAADDNNISMQLGNTADGGTGESFLPATGRNIFCEARWKISDATQSDFLFGIGVTDTTPLTTTDQIAFRKDDGVTTLSFITTASSLASTDSNVGTIVANTYVTVGFKVTDTGLVEYYVNDVKKGSFSTNIPVTEMRPTIHCQNGEAVAKNCSIDYVFCSETR